MSLENVKIPLDAASITMLAPPTTAMTYLAAILLLFPATMATHAPSILVTRSLDVSTQQSIAMT
jgi:hypothetical protein